MTRVEQIYVFKTRFSCFWNETQQFQFHFHFWNVPKCVNWTQCVTVNDTDRALCWLNCTLSKTKNSTKLAAQSLLLSCWRFRKSSRTRGRPLWPPRWHDCFLSETWAKYTKMSKNQTCCSRVNAADRRKSLRARWWDITDSSVRVDWQQLFFSFWVRNSFDVLRFHLREVWTTLH